MIRIHRSVKAALIVSSVIAAIVAAYRVGYSAGLETRGPQYRALTVVWGSGNPKYSGTKYQYFDISRPSEAARLREEQRRLDSIGADYFLDEAHVETNISPKASLTGVNAQR